MLFISLALMEYLLFLIFGIQYPFWQGHLRFHLGPMDLGSMGLGGSVAVALFWPMRSSDPSSSNDWLVKEWAQGLVKSTVPEFCPGVRYTGHCRVTDILPIREA